MASKNTCQGGKMECIFIRHPPWDIIKDGRPTQKGMEKLLEAASPFIKNPVIIVSTGVPRTDVPAEVLHSSFHFSSYRVISELGPLKTAALPPIFGGRLFNTLQKWLWANRLALYLWANGMSFLFTESSALFLDRVKRGIEKLKQLIKWDNQLIIVVVHQETIAAIEAIVKKISLRETIKKEVPHLGTYILDPFLLIRDS